jgi:CheY-like chemotaxis protein
MCGHKLLDELATESYDVVMTDLQMPGLDGWTLRPRSQSAGRVRP